MRQLQWLVSVCVLSLLPSLAVAQTSTAYKKVVLITALATELNSRANNEFSPASGFIDNRPVSEGGSPTGGLGALLCEFQLNVTFGPNAAPAIPAAGSALTLWILRCLDDNTCASQPTATVTVGVMPNLSFPVVTGQSQSIVVQETHCPPGRWKVVLLNGGTGQPLKEFGNTLIVKLTKLESQ